MPQTEKGLLQLAADFKAAGENYEKAVKSNDLIDFLREMFSYRDMQARIGQSQHEFRTKQEEYYDSID